MVYADEPSKDAGGPAWIGVALLEFWCLYFCPISALSFVHFSGKT